MKYILTESQYNLLTEDNRSYLALEQFEMGVNKIVVKLFTLLNHEKRDVKTRKELLDVIKKYSPYFNIPKGFELYILELYAANYRKDGDYSKLTKDNFVDPRDLKGKVTPNTKSNMYTKAQLPFRGSNLEGYWKTRNGKKYYVVESWGWYPVYIFRDGIWYENINRYSNSTAKQMKNSQPYEYNDELDSKVYLLTRDQMDMIVSGYSHEEVMKDKREKLKKIEPELKSKRPSMERIHSGWNNVRPSINIKYKVNSVEDEGDKSIVTVDIFDVLKREDGKSVPTPENYLKGELQGVDKESVENMLTSRLNRDFANYIGPKFDKMGDKNIKFKFNHLKK